MRFESTALDDNPSHSLPVPVLFDDDAVHACAAAFMWCFHCERAFRFGAARDAESRPACPYVGCEDTRAQPWDWLRVRGFNPEYPGQPTQGVVYPLFGRGTYVRL